MPAFDQLTLRTDRLVLRPLCEADAPALYAIFSDPQVMRYWSTPPWASLDEAHAMVARDRKALPLGEYLRLGIVLAESGVLIGHCSLFNLSAGCRRGEVGYGMASAAWGHGYMHEALQALLDHGFAALDLNRVEADIDPRNLGSARSLERLGFTREGFLRERWIVDGEVSDTGLYGLLRSEWKARPVVKGTAVSGGQSRTGVAPTTHHGRCLCGAIRYTVQGPLAPVEVCHCSQCRQAQGGPFATNIPVQVSAFSLMAGQEFLQHYTSSPGKTRCFCRQCGSPLYSQRAALPGVLRLRAGTLEGEVASRPVFHAYFGSKANWWPVNDALPKHDGPAPR